MNQQSFQQLLYSTTLFLWYELVIVVLKDPADYNSGDSVEVWGTDVSRGTGVKATVS